MILLFATGCARDRRESRHLTADTQGRVTVDDFQDDQPGRGLPSRWGDLVFSAEHGEMEYSVVQEEGNRFLRAHADNASAGIVTPVTVDLEATPVLTWRWRAHELPEGGDLSVKATDDAAARVFVMFEYTPDRLSGGMESLYFLASLRYGQYPPLYSLVYVWDTEAEEDTIISSPHTEQAKIIVLESGEENLGRWVTERRNVLEDFHRAFGDVAPTPVEGVGVVTDTDNLHGEVTTDYDDFMFLPVDEPE
jgi:hypothetical protein